MGRRLLRFAAWVLGAWAVAGCGPGSGIGPSAATASLIPWSTPTATATPPRPPPTVEATVQSGPTPTPFKHIVRPNETILAIAALYGVSEQDLRSLNPELGTGSLLTIGQELLIPDPEGNPIGSLIPTATPIPLALQAPMCVTRPSSGVVCLTAVRNGSDQVLENLVVEIRAIDPGGETIRSAEASAPLTFLPSGGRMPVSAVFDESPGRSWSPSAIVRSAIPAGQLETRYAVPVLAVTTDQRQPGGLSWLVGGTVTVPEEAPVPGRTLILATALDTTDRVVGFAVWEPKVEPFPGETQPFEVRVFSLGPPIARVDLLAETYVLARPRE